MHSPQSRSMPPQQARWQLSPYVLLRLAGKSYAELERLKFAHTVPLLHRIITLQRELATAREALSEELFALIGTSEGTLRGQLVALRRDLYNGRQPPRSRLRLLRTLAGRSLRAQALILCRRTRQLERVLRQARATFERELAEKRALLQDSLRDPEFQKAIQVASPAVFEGLNQYLKAEPTALRTRARKAEVGLYRYIVRMAAKTSPFSRFGPVALASYSPNASHALHINLESPTIRGQSELQLSLVSAIADRVGLDPAVFSHLRPVVNPAMYERDSELVLMRPYTPIKRLSSPGAALRRGPYPQPVRDFVAFVQQHRHQCWTLQELIAAYAASLNAPQTTVQAFVKRLIDSGLLLNQLRLPSDAPDRLASLVDELWTLDLPCTRQMAQRVEHLRTLVNSFSAADVIRRQQILRTLHDTLNELLSGYPLHQRVQNDFQHMLVEDVLLDGLHVELGPAFFRPFLNDMAALLDCIYARDQGGLGYASLHDAFVKHYGLGGRCTTVQQFITEHLAYELHQAERTAISSNQPVALNDGRPRVNSTNRRLMQYLDRLNKILAAAPLQPEAQLSRAVLEELTTSFGGSRDGPASAAFHFQLAADDPEAIERGDYLVILNYSLSGFGRFFTRYWKLLGPEQGGWLLDQIRERCAELVAHLPPGHNAVEILSVLENNAQVHPRMSERQLVVPHEHSALPVERQILPHELELTHNTATDDIRLYRRDPMTGQRCECLVPLYMGFFHPGSVLFHHRAYLDLSPTAYLPGGLRPSEFLPAALGRPAAGEHRTITHYPRLTIGRLVLQRELWTVPAEVVPRVDGDDFKLFLHYVAWASEQGLPTEFFVRVRCALTDPSSVTDISNINKPLLVDSENFFAWRMFHHMLQNDTLHTLFIEEMLPTPRQLFFSMEQQPYVVEFQIEFNCGGNT